jgi:hypothetical protein
MFGFYDSEKSTVRVGSSSEMSYAANAAEARGTKSADHIDDHTMP